LLLEETTGRRPTHGYLVTGDHTRHRIENTEQLRSWALDLARQIRAARQQVNQLIPVEPRPGQCHPCGMRGHCTQARL